MTETGAFSGQGETKAMEQTTETNELSAVGGVADEPTQPMAPPPSPSTRLQSKSEVLRRLRLDVAAAGAAWKNRGSGDSRGFHPALPGWAELRSNTAVLAVLAIVLVAALALIASALAGSASSDKASSIRISEQDRGQPAAANGSRRDSDSKRAAEKNTPASAEESQPPSDNSRPGVHAPGGYSPPVQGVSETPAEPAPAPAPQPTTTAPAPPPPPPDPGTTTTP
jgi:hypothetical protein